MRLLRASGAALLLLSLGLLASCGGGSSDGSTATISAESGGRISSDDGLLTLDVPPGALAANTVISIQAVSIDDLPDDVAEGAEGAVAYRLEPDGLTFSKPVIAKLRLDPQELTSSDADGVLQIPLLLVQSEGEIPELLANLDFAVSFDDGSASISGEVEHFSWIKSVKGSMQISLQQPDESKPLGLSFQVKFSVGRRIISEYRVGENVYISYGRSLSNISGSVIGSEQVVVFIVDGRPGTSFTGPPESHVADLICTQPGKGFYSVNARAEFELAVIGGSGSGKPPETAVVRATVDASVLCVIGGSTPTPTPTSTTFPGIVVGSSTSTPGGALGPTATPTSIVLFDPTTTLPTAGPFATVTPRPTDSSGCDIRVDTSRQGYVSTAEGDRMNVQMDFSHGPGGPAGGISATVEIDKAGDVFHTGATTNDLGRINFLVLNGPHGPHSLHLVELQDQSGAHCNLLPGSTTSASWSVAPPASGEMFFDCTHFDGYSEITITGSGFSPNEVLFGEVFGPVVFGDGSLQVQAVSTAASFS